MHWPESLFPRLPRRISMCVICHAMKLSWSFHGAFMAYVVADSDNITAQSQNGIYLFSNWIWLGK